jgi:hypothetical protein
VHPRQPAHQPVFGVRAGGRGVERVLRLVGDGDRELAGRGGDQRRRMQVGDVGGIGHADAAVEHGAQLLEHLRHRHALVGARVERFDRVALQR